MIFTDLSVKNRIQLINALFKTDFEYQDVKKIHVLNSEHHRITGNLNKHFVRGDVSLLIEFNDDKKSQSFILEFQSTPDEKMGFRMFIYALNASELVEGKQRYVFPKSLTIYTTFGVEREGFDEVEFEMENFSVDGMDFTNKVLTVKFPFINLFEMSLQEMLDRSYNSLQPLLLYRYKNKPEILKIEKFDDVIKTIDNNLQNYRQDNEDFILLNSCMYMLLADILNIIENDPNYEKELKKMQTLKKNSAQMLIDTVCQEEKAKYNFDMLILKNQCEEEKARHEKEKARLEKEKALAIEKEKALAVEKEKALVKKMLEDLPDEVIAKYVGMSVEDIAKIREEDC